MNRQQALDSAKLWFTQWQLERTRLDNLDPWLRGKQDPPLAARRRSTDEHRMLRDLSVTPHLGLVVTTLAQTLKVDGYRSPSKPTTDDNAPSNGPASPWDIFLANGMPAKQFSVVWASLGYGYSYLKILPGLSPTGRKMAALTPRSPRTMFTAWTDPANDDWPMLALDVEQQPNKSFMLKLYDETDEHRLTVDASGAKFDYIDYSVHAVGHCPVARCANQLDLEGRTLSEIEPLIGIGRRIDKTVYDRLLAQHFNSWKVRTIAGLAQPDPPEGLSRDEQAAWLNDNDAKAKLRLANEDILVAEDPDARFGTLDATTLDGYINAHESDLEDLSGTSQMARHNLGQMVNMPAEAFTAAETMQQRRSNDRKETIGRFWNQSLRAAAALSENAAAAADYQAGVTWADSESRSLSQAADALGKLASQLGIPPEGLWERIPGVTDTDIAGWRAMLQANTGFGALTEQLDKVIAGMANPPTAGA